MRYKLRDLPTFGDVKKVFFVGIKGVGVAPLALITHGAGIKVAGSDVAEHFITDKYLAEARIPISTGFEVKDIEAFFGNEIKEECLVITTGAHKGFDNAQVKWARNQGIEILTQGQALALYMEGEIIDRDVKGVSIAGSHGKTTITSLLATTVKAMGLDPSYVIGTGEVFPLGAPGYLGRGDLFIAEADEYASEPVYDKVPKLLYQKPFYAIFNNIDFDHPDIFNSVDEIVDVFEEFAHNIRSGGLLFVNGDDKYLSEFKQIVGKDIRVVTYGGNKNNDYIATKIVADFNSTKFTVIAKGVELGVFETRLIGRYNAGNALAVVAFLSEIGYEPQEIKTCLRVFEGSKRRSEQVGKMGGGALVIDDYGHHPLEISTTISAIKSSHPGKKLICVFQPHTFSRTKAMLGEFADSFALADEVVLLPVFKSARDTEQDTVTGKQMVDAFGKNTNVTFIENFADVVEYVSQKYSTSEYIILTIGAGDVYKIGSKLVAEK